MIRYVKRNYLNDRKQLRKAKAVYKELKDLQTELSKPLTKESYNDLYNTFEYKKRVLENHLIQAGFNSLGYDVILTYERYFI